VNETIGLRAAFAQDHRADFLQPMEERAADLPGKRLSAVSASGRLVSRQGESQPQSMPSRGSLQRSTSSLAELQNSSHL
jgi:hypothetical protein